MSLSGGSEQYAAEHGLELFGKFTLPRADTALGFGHRTASHAMIGEIGGRRHGIMYLCAGGRALGPPAAQFEIERLDELVDCLWVRRSGRSFLWRIKVPKRLTEVTLDDDAFAARYRVAVADADDELFARRLLNPVFCEAWLHLTARGAASTQCGSFELSQGMLFVRGDQGDFTNPQRIDTFAAMALELADRVAIAVRQSPVRR